ncbi:hypothetical protein D3C85_1559100 [compost metagenome]
MFFFGIVGLAAADVGGGLQAVFALLLAQTQLVFGTLGQAVMGQLQLAHIHIVFVEAVDAQQRVQVLGVHTELLQLAILVGHDLREKLV